MRLRLNRSRQDAHLKNEQLFSWQNDDLPLNQCRNDIQGNPNVVILALFTTHSRNVTKKMFSYHLNAITEIRLSIHLTEIQAFQDNSHDLRCLRLLPHSHSKLKQFRIVV